MCISSIKKELIPLIADLFNNRGVDTELIEYVSLIDDLGMDSLIFISVVIRIEERFGIVVPDDYLLLERFNSIDDIAEIIIKSQNTLE